MQKGIKTLAWSIEGYALWLIYNPQPSASSSHAQRGGGAVVEDQPFSHSLSDYSLLRQAEQMKTQDRSNSVDELLPLNMSSIQSSSVNNICIIEFIKSSLSVNPCLVSRSLYFTW